MLWRKCLGFDPSPSSSETSPRAYFPTFIASLVLILIIALTTGLLAAPTDPLMDLKAAVAALESKRDAVAISALKPLVGKLPRLADYVAWFLASAQFDAEDYQSVPKSLDKIWTQTPPSPLMGKAAILGAQALEKSGHAPDAVELLRKNDRALPQPQGDAEMARALAAAGDPVRAAAYAQRIYYGYPSSALAADALAQLVSLQAQLGEKMPVVPGPVIIARALKLLDSGDAVRARREFTQMESQLTGADRDLARVKIGVADYQIRDASFAQKYLKALTVESPAADAERLYYLFLCARRIDDRRGMDDMLEKLGTLYPTSPFRLEALVASANSYLINNQMDDYEPLYRACYEAFPNDAKAAGCHWKVTWMHYLRRRPDAVTMLREQLRRFPESDDAPAALYYLARLAEASQDVNSASAYYREILRQYPNRYYTVLARTRLEESSATLSLASSRLPVQSLSPGSSPTAPIPPSEASRFLREISFSSRPHTRDFEPNPIARLRIDRANMLSVAGLDEWAEFELRSAAQALNPSDDQPHVIALELARLTSAKGSPDQALRYLKRFVPDYLSLSMESAPAEFWRLAFPLPYRADLEKYARENQMDPFLMAALVRQESEFNPKAISPSNARGLAQIMPATGRDLSRRLRVKSYVLAHLFEPQVSLRLGTYYLKSISDQLGGRWEAALAAYNAGLTRANTWSGWGEFREPSEFVETVPFSQTRNYVQIVLRNADVYRQLYASPKIAGITTPLPTASEPAARLSYTSDGLNQAVSNPASSNQPASAGPPKAASGKTGKSSAKQRSRATAH